MNSEEIAQVAQQVTDHLVNAGAIARPRVKQKKISWERYLVQEYLWAKYPYAPRWIRKEVGYYKPSDMGKLYARNRRWVDAIVRLPDGILLIEAKMKSDPGAVSQLAQYVKMFPATPEFKKYSTEKVRGLVLSAMDVPEVKELAADFGLEYDVYQPTVFEKWYAANVVAKQPNPASP